MRPPGITMDKLIMRVSDLKKKSHELREKVLEMCIKAGTGHVTSCLSCTEILVALYYGGTLRFDSQRPKWEQRDRLILSKGQASPLLYAILADLGFFPSQELDHFAQPGGIFGVHLQHDVPGVEITAGALGHGFGVAAGLALAARMNRELFLTFVILGDGELYEGSIWETAMFAAHQRLNNLVAVIDRNYLCTTDFTENLVELEPLADKWRSFGWNVEKVDGHSLEQLLTLLKGARSRKSSRPLMIIADTVKGEGVECMGNIPLYHGIPPREEHTERAREQLKKYPGSESK